MGFILIFKYKVRETFANDQEKYKISTGVTCPTGYTNIYEDNHIKGVEKCNEALKELNIKTFFPSGAQDIYPKDSNPKGCWITGQTNFRADMVVGFAYYNRHKNPNPTTTKYRDKFAACRLIPTDDEKNEKDDAKKKKLEKEKILLEINTQIIKQKDGL